MELVDLVTATCPHCKGEGYLVSFDMTCADALSPEENLIPCPECDGEGELELCSCCSEPLEIRQGRAVCACNRIELAKAA